MGEQGECGLNMAVRYSPGSPKQQEHPACSEVDAKRSLDSNGDCRVSSPRSSERDTADAYHLNSECNDGYMGSGAGVLGLCNSQTGIRTVCHRSDASFKSNLVVDLTGSEAEAHVHTGVACDGCSEFECSETEDELELCRAAKENNVPESEIDISSDLTSRGREDCMPGLEERCLQLHNTGKIIKDEEIQLHGKEGTITDAEMEAKERKSRLVCRECGKRFTRRETFNLHRHFHTHQDELASLTCKDCGLTFQHRSSLIKHRSEHKGKGTTVGLEKKPHNKEGKSLQCEHCAEIFLTLGKLRCHPCQQAPEKSYRCPLCRREFKYRVSINVHMQSHSLENPFRCLECNKGFPCGFMLRIHQRSHAALKPFECPECGMVFRHHSVMEDHRRRHKVDRPRQCNICGKRFKSTSLFHHHRFLHTGKKPFLCPMCGKAFAFAQNMRAHWRQHWKHTHDCPRCPLTFPDLAGLQTHMMNHDREQRPRVLVGTCMNRANSEGLQYSHKCPFCPLSLSNLTTLKAHLLSHEEREEFGDWGRGNVNSESQRLGHACPHCAFTFPSLTSLQMHLLSHGTASKEGLAVLGTVNMNNGEDISMLAWPVPLTRKMLKCTECGKTFHHRSVLELHMRIHSKDKPFHCRVCGKGFKFSSYLQQHLIIHTGQKPFKCPDCGKDFAFLQNMKTHQRLHQQKPYRCTQCRKGYSEEAELQRHMLSHTGDKPHKCQLCDKSFGLAYLLRDHLNTHTGERPHRCAECHKSFPWLSSLLVHQKIHARKRQGLNQPFSFTSQRGRGRGQGTRGRRGSRWASGWSWWAGGEDTAMPVQPPGQISKGQECHEKISQQHSVSERHVTVRHQWQSEVQGRPVLTQQPADWIHLPASTQVDQAARQYNESHPKQTDGISAWAIQASPVPSQNLVSRDKLGDEQKKKQQQALGWTSRPPSTSGQTTVQYEDAHVRCSEGTAVWEFNTPQLAQQNLLEKPGECQNQQRPLVTWSDAAILTPMRESATHYEESRLQQVEKISPWRLQGLPAQRQNLCPTSNFSGEQKQQWSFGWISKPTSAHGNKTTACYQNHQPLCGDGTAVWELQTPPAVSCAQSPKDKFENKQQPVAEDQVGLTPYSSSPPIALPPASSYSDVSSSYLQPQNSYLTRQTAVSEECAKRNLPPVQKAKLCEPDGAHPPTILPFATNPLLQCMICGCSLPRELDLHIHYVQHAQGEI